MCAWTNKTGGIVELRAAGIDANLADTAGGHAINDYLYLIGDDLAALQRNGPVKITVRERGPLVASLLVESDAPGCHKLVREIRLCRRRGLRRAARHRGQEAAGGGELPRQGRQGERQLRLPLQRARRRGAARRAAGRHPARTGPDAERLQELADARAAGPTWPTTISASRGSRSTRRWCRSAASRATLLNSQTDPDSWRKKIEPTQKLYSWAMNNHWHTNYRAYQEGPVQFRFVLRPHRGTRQRRRELALRHRLQPAAGRRARPRRRAARDAAPARRAGRTCSSPR